MRSWLRVPAAWGLLGVSWRVVRCCVATRALISSSCIVSWVLVSECQVIELEIIYIVIIALFFSFSLLADVLFRNTQVHKFYLYFISNFLSHPT